MQRVAKKSGHPPKLSTGTDRHRLRASLELAILSRCPPARVAEHTESKMCWRHAWLARLANRLSRHKRVGLRTQQGEAPVHWRTQCRRPKPARAKHTESKCVLAACLPRDASQRSPSLARAMQTPITPAR